MSRVENVILTNMCMIYDGSHVLVQEKIDDDYSGITFPGGHVEKAESFTDAVIREVFEETGLEISSPQLCGIKDWTNDDGTRYVVLFYKTNKFQGEIKSSDEGKVYWIELDKIDKKSFAIGMEKMIEVFMNDSISEYFYRKDSNSWIEELK